MVYVMVRVRDFTAHSFCEIKVQLHGLAWVWARKVHHSRKKVVSPLNLHEERIRSKKSSVCGYWE